MHNITVRKSRLLDILNKNRAEHRQIYEEAIEGYRKLVISEFEKRLNNAKNGKKIDIYFHITQPVDQTKDYDRAIGMLEMTLDETISLSEQDFARYVQNDWNWMQNFLVSNSLYSGTATSKLHELGLEDQ